MSKTLQKEVDVMKWCAVVPGSQYFSKLTWMFRFFWRGLKSFHFLFGGSENQNFPFQSKIKILKLEHVNVIKMDVTLSYMRIFKTIQISLLITMLVPNDESTQVQTLSEVCDIIDKMELEQDTTIVWVGDLIYFLILSSMLMVGTHN